MTTNKPEVVAWTNSVFLARLREMPHTGAGFKAKGQEESGFRDGLVRLSDYEVLQAECEKLRKHLQNLIDQTTPLEPVPGDPMWSRRIQLDEVIAERDQLRAECEKLRKDAERYRWLKARLYVVDTYSGKGISYEIGIDGAEVPDIHDPTEAIDAAMQGGNP